MEYSKQIEEYIKRNEVNKKARRLEENRDTLNNYWNIGRLIVEAQGGEARAKYGNELIKKWSKDYTETYGKGYDSSNLKRFRQFYLIFQKGGPVAHQLSWSHYQYLLPIKEENKRNYYINLCIQNHLTKRELILEIKNHSYERLIDKPEKIEIIKPENKNILSEMKNPIMIEAKKEIQTEHDLEIAILAQLKEFSRQLGNGYAFFDNQYRVVYEGNIFFIDLLLFNIEINAYVVIELKLRELRKEDKGQIEFYMKAIDQTLKQRHHNKTMGIIITKEQNKLIANYFRSSDIIPLTYEIV